jgi:undecaprenyl diphosphate synthase
MSVESQDIPQHVAIVMDGNGRWAKRRFMPRFFGHKAGVDTLVRVINQFADRGVKYLTVYAFSSENWKRPEDEVSGLMGLVLVAVSKYLSRMVADGVRIRVIGDREGVSQKLRDAWDEAEAVTSGNTRITVSVAFNYGGRWDIVQACRRLIAEGATPEQVTEQSLGRHTALAHAPELDLLIRTGGELRISNFLLWQTAYAELVFTDCLWPDFGAEEIDRALAAYAARDRRFGGLRHAPVPVEA